MLTKRPTDDLDPRRQARGAWRRDFRSISATVAIPRVHELLARALVRIGLVR